MTAKDKQLIKATLETLTHLVYTALIDVEKLNQNSPEKITELNNFKRILEDQISEELFTS